MQIKILTYFASVRSDVQAFIDLEVNGWLRFNGIHFQRDGTLRSAQLTPMRNGRRVFLPAVEVFDADLRELLTADILAAIHKHLETLPPEKRVKPPRPIAPSDRPVNAQRAPEKPAATLHAQPASAIPEPRKPTPEKANPKTLAPPLRLLANLPRAARSAVGEESKTRT
jgi:hypothetical protein